MAILSFNAEAVRRIVTHAKAAPAHDMGWLADTAPQPAVMLVGDHGVYLMSNGSPRDPAEDNGGSTFVSYTLGIDPGHDADWWETKRALYGGDDGADTLLVIETLELLLARGEAFIRIEITEDHIGVLVPDVSWITTGTLVGTPSGLGGVFRARVLRAFPEQKGSRVRPASEETFATQMCSDGGRTRSNGKCFSVTDTHASVCNTGNVEDFDKMPPYLVPLGRLRALKTEEAI